MFGPRYANVLLYQQSELLEKVVELAEKGEVEVIVQEIIMDVLKEGSNAWKRVWALMEEGRVREKIVVEIN
jgi:bifunctional pyridoxal-dependent enzyme with beta-cystathionase and maltose regulon repressor activities